MSACVMMLLTMLGIFVAPLAAWHSYILFCKLGAWLRMKLTVPMWRPLVILPASAAIIALMLVATSIGYGWKHAEPCGQRVASASVVVLSTNVCVAVSTFLSGH